MPYKVGVVMGSDSDWETMRKAVEVMEQLGITVEARILSAHRTPEAASAYAREAAQRGLSAIVAGAGRAAHLPGVLAAFTTLPVIGVPIGGGPLGGTDALYSIVQMPPGVPVATMAIDGALNAGLFAAQIIALSNEKVHAGLTEYRRKMAESVLAKDAKLQARGV